MSGWITFRLGFRLRVSRWRGTSVRTPVQDRTVTAATVAPGSSRLLPDWRDLCSLPDDELAKFDIAVVNLACAVGLPGSERMDAARCLRCLDDWAIGVRQLTENALQTDFPRLAEKYSHSEPLFRMVRLVHLLQDHCKVLYNPAQDRVPSPTTRSKQKTSSFTGRSRGRAEPAGVSRWSTRRSPAGSDTRSTWC